jgi:hypothetical protein
MIIPCDFLSLFSSEEALKPDVLIKTIRILRFQIDFLSVKFSPVLSSAATNFVFDLASESDGSEDPFPS